MSEWISVEDRLPEDGVPVWGMTEDGDIFVYAIGYVGEDEGYIWGNTYGNFWRTNEKVWDCDFDQDDEYIVTHWMPLPEPPEK